MIRFLRILALLFVAITYVTLTGCATPANPQAMIVNPDASIAPNEKLKGMFAIGSIIGGQDTNPLWTSQVDNKSFGEALRGTLAAFGYLASDPASAKHRIDANLMSLAQPLFGLTFDVQSNVQYVVITGDSKKEYLVSASGVATFSDSALAIERLRIANEKSIKENITQFLRRLISP